MAVSFEILSGHFGQCELLLGSVWDEIELICNYSFRLSALKQHLKKETSCVDKAIKDLILEGQKLTEGISEL